MKKRAAIVLAILLVPCAFFGAGGLVVWGILAVLAVVSQGARYLGERRVDERVAAGDPPLVVQRYYPFARDFERDADKMLRMGYRIRAEGRTKNDGWEITYVYADSPTLGAAVHTHDADLRSARQ